MDPTPSSAQTLAVESSSPAQTISQRPSWIRRSVRPLILISITALIIAQVVALSPSSVEDTRNGNPAISPESLVPRGPVTLAPGIPANRVPEYTIEEFNYVSTHGSEKEWNLLATKAFLYHKEKLVHARTVKAFLYDPDGKITVVTGREAKYGMNQRDLEIYGDVKTTFPDGFEIHSEYMHYLAQNKRIEIPSSYDVTGAGKEPDGQTMEFKSRGLTYLMKIGEITLLNDVQVTVSKPESEKTAVQTTANSKPAPDKKLNSKTLVEADHAVIRRSEQIAHFTMNPKRPLSKRFVYVTQPTLLSKGRRAEMNYGNFGGDKLLHYMVLYDDVLIKEIGAEELRYATGGQADFDAKKDIVILRKFPQVYQGPDTVTGDVILLHRDTDIVEVEHSNAFSQGASF